MEIDAPVAVWAYAFASLFAHFTHLVQAFARVVGGIDWHRERVEAKDAITCLNREPGTLLRRCVSCDARDLAGSVIALNVVAYRPAEQLMDGSIQRLSFDVPQRQVERTDCVSSFAAWRIKVAAIHVLPQMLNELRIAAD